MEQPLVLVVIPLYNARPFFKEALDSIIVQTYKNLEILVINDGSTDGSESILNEYQDKGITIWNQENLGPGAAMNKAIQYAHEKGIEFIARMDADDIAIPERIEKQIDLLSANPKAAACSANCLYIDEQNGRVIGTSTVSTSSKMIKWEIGHGLRGLIQGATIFRTRDIFEIGGYDSQFKFAEETDLFLRLIENKGLINSKDYLLKIRLNTSSLSMQNMEQNINYQVYALFCANARKKGTPKKSFKEFMNRKNPGYDYRIWREITFLNNWRHHMENNDILPLILAGIIDPRRIVIRILRNIRISNG